MINVFLAARTTPVYSVFRTFIYKEQFFVICIQNGQPMLVYVPNNIKFKKIKVKEEAHDKDLCIPVPVFWYLL